MKNLEPQAIWQIFDEITHVPRPSKKEEKIAAWLVEFAHKHGLEYRRDKMDNVVIIRPASSGMESHEGVIVQNHVDMVCEKNADREFDFERDPIETFVADGWVRARGTTLGADNGVGMALALALLIDNEIVAPKIEALFTVDEETGLTGAMGLEEGMITGKYLINLDSEDEGEVFIGCAGGIDTVAKFEHSLEPINADYQLFEIAVVGLKGGHSGDDIEKGRGNSNRILARALYKGMELCELRLAEIDGGNLRNAIPREARAVVAIPAGQTTVFKHYIAEFAREIKAELEYSDSGVEVVLTPVKSGKPTNVIAGDTALKLVKALIGAPNGVQAMSGAMEGLVETSTNLASVKMTDNQIIVTTSQRSSRESTKAAAAKAVGAVFELAGARVEHSAGYPGWTPDPSSRLLEITQAAYRKLFGREIEVKAIHAGLECGLFLERFPHLEMVSTGPTILGAHSPDERLEVATVAKVWRLLSEIVRNL